MFLFINFFSSFFDFFKFLYFVLSLGCMCSISACYQAIFSVLKFFISYYPSESLSPFVVLPRFSCSLRISIFFFSSILFFEKFFFPFLLWLSFSNLLSLSRHALPFRNPIQITSILLFATSLTTSLILPYHYI